MGRRGPLGPAGGGECLFCGRRTDGHNLQFMANTIMAGVSSRSPRLAPTRLQRAVGDIFWPGRRASHGFSGGSPCALPPADVWRWIGQRPHGCAARQHQELGVGAFVRASPGAVHVQTVFSKRHMDMDIQLCSDSSPADGIAWRNGLSGRVLVAGASAQKARAGACMSARATSLWS